jgi:hypothetical protein
MRGTPPRSRLTCYTFPFNMSWGPIVRVVFAILFVVKMVHETCGTALEAVTC